MTDDTEREGLARWSDTNAPETRAAATESVIFHVDMDCFYASCERLRRPELRDEPVVVGMGYEPGDTAGAVATASYEAREFGVESAMPISEALAALPRRTDPDAPTATDGDDPDASGHYVPVDLDYYTAVAATVKRVLHDCADVVRKVSIDEAYLDVTDRTGWAVAGDTDAPEPSAAAGPASARTLAEGYARHVKERIEREAGVPASVGVAPNMSTAKVASDADKPDGLVVVPPERIREFLAPLPTVRLHGVGPVTERELAELGIDTVGDLAAADPETLIDALGERGRELYDRARGDDDREVTPTGRPKSLSRESSLAPTDEVEPTRETVRALAADVARRARERGCLYRTVGIKVVEPPYDVNTRARSLPGPVDDPDVVESVALDLLAEFADARVRKLGVRVSKLDFGESDQSTLAGFDGATGDADPTGDDGATVVVPESRTAAGSETPETIDDWLDRATDADGAVEDRERVTEDREGAAEDRDAGDADDGGSRDGQASLGEW